MATIAHVQSGSTSGSGTTSITVSLSSSPTKGNLLVLGLMGRLSSSNDPSSKSNGSWTEITTVSNGSDARSVLWYKVADGTESTSFTVSFGDRERYNVFVSEFSGTRSKLVADKSNSNSGSGSGETITFSSISPELSGKLIVMAACHTNNPDWTTPSGYTQLTTVGNACSLWAGYKITSGKGSHSGSGSVDRDDEEWSSITASFFDWQGARCRVRRVG